MKITHLILKQQFEILIDNHKAKVIYEIDHKQNTIDIVHTVVPHQIAGRGIAHQLVQTTFTWGASQGLSPKATCSYAQKWLKKRGLDLLE
jgi:predicted GNAT family acetyltransferase